MTRLRLAAAMAAGVLTATLGGFEAHAQPAAPVEARNVVLIHGAWADGSPRIGLGLRWITILSGQHQAQPILMLSAG